MHAPYVLEKSIDSDTNFIYYHGQTANGHCRICYLWPFSLTHLLVQLSYRSRFKSFHQLNFTPQIKAKTFKGISGFKFTHRHLNVKSKRRPFYP